MANTMLALLLLLMLTVSLRAITKPSVVSASDDLLLPHTSHRGWSVLFWLAGLILLIAALRLLFG